MIILKLYQIKYLDSINSLKKFNDEDDDYDIEKNNKKKKLIK